MRMMRALKNPGPVSTQICLNDMLLSARVSRPCLSWKSLCLGNDHPNPVELLWSFSDDCYGRSHESVEESESLQQRESLHSVSASARIAVVRPLKVFSNARAFILFPQARALLWSAPSFHHAT